MRRRDLCSRSDFVNVQLKVSGVFRIPRSNPWPPTIDLATVRETLMYIQDDMRRVPALAGVAAALETTLVEIGKAERSQKKVPLSPISSRFLPARN